MDILLLDNNQQDLLNAAKIIGKMGHSVKTCSDGAKAVELVHNYPFDLILTELTLDTLNGFSTVENIRALPDRRGNLPIIALANTRDPEDVRKCFKSGMNNFILKPLTETNFSSAIHLYTVRKKDVLG